MNSQGVLIVLVTLVLCATTYVAVSLPARDADPERTASDNAMAREAATAQAVAELAGKIEQLAEQLDRRLDVVEQQLAKLEELPGGRRGTTASRQLAGFGRADDMTEADDMTHDQAADPAEALAARVAESVQGQLDAKLERLASRQRNRNMGGEWKAPMDELAAELKLSDAQKEAAMMIFDDARDEVFDLFKTARPDGGTLLDDLVTSLRKGETDALPRFVGRIFSDQVPGSDQTYLGQLISMSARVKQNLSPHLTTEQLLELEGLNVAMLEVETGYDPVAEYIRTQSQ